MMLHRHFNGENSSDNLTTLADLTPGEKREESILTEEPEEAPKKRGRKPRMGE